MRFMRNIFYDSVLPFLHTNATSLCDVGAGAGFPSIPVKILYPDLEITILEPLAKRIRFLEALCSELQLTNVHCLHVRAEEYAAAHRECFDIVSARAVASLPVLSELCLPLVRVGGQFIAMKGPGAKEEVLAAKHAIETLGARLEKQEETLLSDGAVRINVFYYKEKQRIKISKELWTDQEAPIVGDERMRESKTISIDEIRPNPYQPRIDLMMKH